MSKPLAVVPADAFVYRAIGRMSRLKMRHLGVVDEAGSVIGALSARDLLRLRAGEAVALGDEIEEAQDVHDLARAWAKLPQVAASLLVEVVSTRDVAAVISRELGALTRQAAVIAEARCAIRGKVTHYVPMRSRFGRPRREPAGHGSGQRHGLANGAPGSPEDSWFEKLGIHIAVILHEVGVPYCKGGVMAKSPQWRGSVATWRKRVDDWIRCSSPEALLSVDIFFDMRPVHGDGSLCTNLWRGAFDAAHDEIGFAKLLAEAGGRVRKQLWTFRPVQTSHGRIDLKRTGLFGIITTARVLALRHHAVERSTLARLAGIKALGIGAENDLDALVEAQGIFLDLLVSQPIEDIEDGLHQTWSQSSACRPRDRARLRSATLSLAQSPMLN